VRGRTVAHARQKPRRRIFSEKGALHGRGTGHSEAGFPKILPSARVSRTFSLNGRRETTVDGAPAGRTWRAAVAGSRPRPHSSYSIQLIHGRPRAERAPQAPPGSTNDPLQDPPVLGRTIPKRRQTGRAPPATYRRLTSPRPPSRGNEVRRGAVSRPASTRSAQVPSGPPVYPVSAEALRHTPGPFAAAGRRPQARPPEDLSPGSG